MQKKFIPAFIVAAAVGLSGCAAPGLQLKPGNKAVISQPGEEAGIDLDKIVDIVPITPALVRGMETAQANTINANYSRAVLPTGAYQYRVGSGDILNIIVWDHPALNPSVGQSTTSALGVSGSLLANRTVPGNTGSGTVVDAQGNIFFPYAGTMHVAGLTAAQIRANIASRLARYIRIPQVDVNVVGFQSKRINIAGAVKNPAQMSLANVPMTVLDAVNAAGGFNPNANISAIRVTRADGTSHTLSLYDAMQQGNMAQNMLLRPDDVVFVPTNEQSKVFVMGEVKRQATLYIPQGGMTLTDALGMGEGINQDVADSTGVFVIRNTSDPHRPDKIANVYQLNLKDASAFAMGNRFKLHPNDVVFVTVSPVARWNRVLGQIFPSVAVLGNLAAVVSTTK